MNNTYKKSDNSITVIVRLMKLFKKGYIWLAITVMGSLLGGVSSILLAKGIKGMSDAALAHDIGTLMNYLYIILAAMALDVTTSILRTYSSGRFSNYSIMTLRNLCQEHIAGLQMSYIDDNRTGDLLSRMTNDIREVQRFIGNILISLLTSSILFATAITYMFILNWKLTLLSSILMPVFTIIVAKVSKKIERTLSLSGSVSVLLLKLI